MVKVYYDSDVSLEPLNGKTVAIIGYGSQGKAQAQNMRDSGVNVILGLRPEGSSWSAAVNDGFKVYQVSEAVKRADIVHMLVPDLEQPKVYRSQVEPYMSSGKALCFSHGFNIHFKQIVPPSYVDVMMVAPKSPGPRLRGTYLEGFGVPALVAVYQNPSGKALETALAIAKSLGCTRAGVLETTFKEETETDLVGEQAVLVGGLMELIKKGFEVLVEAGYQPELAYFEVCNEAKLIMDLIYQKGFIGMLRAVSDTAKYGGITVGPKVIDEHVKNSMKKVVERVQNGEFAKEWTEKAENAKELLEAMMKEIEEHPIEKVGRFIRKMAGIEK
ncbi:MAG: ketol-acid reductoisomerase [Candidatus Bathyarchaeota archaeon]|nr:ketol-acid reductoisomerase [Candidatus Bathyarchaeota archaeon]MCX8176726.1 ketol-acid reductoisomerase [Candidatus Bathyarchaeota archaeon]MDW8193254.1 ketol-acid reductoisomerase [Nitrososphaerota archaeon]